MNAVEDGDVDYGLLPVENTTAGSINEVYDLLSVAQLSIVGEEVLRVEHCLLGVEEVPLASIRQIYSHPQALAECMKFVAKLPNCQALPYADSAMAVKKVKEDKNPKHRCDRQRGSRKTLRPKSAAPEHRRSAEQFHALSDGGQKAGGVDLRIPCKTSLIMATSHEEGALLKA